MSLSTSSKVLWLAPLSAAMLMLAACSGGGDTTDASADNASGETQETLRIATESSYKPFSYTDANGKVVGYEIELMDALCEQMKVTCDISSQDWDGLIPGLNAQKFDAAIAGMSITPERQEVVDFSDPYYYSGIVLIGKKGDDITVNDLKGQPIGAQRATVSSQYLQDEHKDADIKLYDTQDNAYLDLTSGRTRAMMSDQVTALNWLTTDAGQNYEIKGDEISTNDDAMGIAFRKGDPLVAKFNTALAAIKDNGTYDQITSSYFGTKSTAAAQPAASTQAAATDTSTASADTTAAQ